MADTAKRRR